LINETKELLQTVIISTGASAKYLGLPSEQHYLKWVVEFLHVQFVMVFYRNQEVVSSLEQGILLVKKHYLSKFVKVTMLVRSENLELQNYGSTRSKTENITILP
jgi:thioredoxin reductase (NADPH)